MSHDARDLGNAALPPLRGKRVPVLAWTLRDADASAAARRLADNVTFEGFQP